MFSKFFTVLIVALIMTATSSHTCLAQSLEFVKATGSGGVGFGGLTGSTRLTDDEVVFIDSYESYEDVSVNRKYLTKFETSSSTFSSKEIRYFRGSKLRTLGIADIDDLMAIVTSDANNSFSLVLFDEKLNLVKQISLPANITGDIEVVGKTRLRLFSSTSGVNEFHTVDLRTSVISTITLDSAEDFIRYRRFGGVDYLLSWYTAAGNHISRVDGTKTTRIVDELGEISGFCFNGKSLTYAAVRSDGPILATVTNGILQSSPYPGPHGNGYFSYTGKIIVPTYIYPLRNNQFVLADDSSIAIVDQKYTFYDRFGSIDSYVDGPQQHAVNEQGETAVGRVGYVSVTNKKNNISIPCLDAQGKPVNITAVSFLPNGDVVASYWGNWDFFRYGNDTGILLISVTDRIVKKRYSTPLGLITDVVVNGQVYYASDGVLYQIDPELSSQPKIVQSNYQVVDLYVQSGYLYVRSANPNRIQKLSKQNVVIDANMFAPTLDDINLNSGSNLTYFGILPDESLLGEFVGYVTKQNRRIPGMYLPPYIGNGAGNMVIVGYGCPIVLRYRN